MTISRKSRPVDTQDKYFLIEKEELMRIVTKYKIGYGEELSAVYNGKLKRHIQKKPKEEFIYEIYQERILHSRRLEKWSRDVSIIIMMLMELPLQRSFDTLLIREGP